jgi:hypothetical protein
VGKKSSKTKTTNEPPKWAVPHLQGAMGTISNTVNANQGNLDQMAGQLRGFLPGLGEKAFGANPGLDAANQYAMDSIGGKYLDQQNPYLQGMIDQTSRDVSNRVNSMFAKAGASMGSPHAQVLSKELANSQNSLRYGNYAQERQMQQGAAGMMPGLNASQYAGVMPYLAATQGAAGLPYAGIQNLGQLGSLLGGAGTQTSTQPGGWGTGLLGAAANMFSFAPISLSEPDAKTSIKLLRREADGLGWYEFAYKRDPAVLLEGVMADEVERLRPHALGPRLANGWRTVNYAKLSEAA